MYLLTGEGGNLEYFVGLMLYSSRKVVAAWLSLLFGAGGGREGGGCSWIALSRNGKKKKRPGEGERSQLFEIRLHERHAVGVEQPPTATGGICIHNWRGKERDMFV